MDGDGHNDGDGYARLLECRYKGGQTLGEIVDGDGQRRKKRPCASNAPAAERPFAVSSMSFTSWGFSAEGISLSITAITSIPPKKRRNCRPTAGAGPHFGDQRILCFEKYLDHGDIDHDTRGKAQGNRQKFSVGVPTEKRDAAANPGAEPSQQCQKKKQAKQYSPK